MIGRGIGLLRGSSSGWCVRCSSGCDNLENGGQAGSRRQWLGPLTTDGQPCDEHLTHQPLLEPLRRPTPRPIMIVHSRTSRSRRPSPEQRPFCSRPRCRARCTVGVVHTCHVLPMKRLRLSSNFVIHAAAIDRQAFNNAQSMARCQRLRTIAASPWTRLAAASGTGLRVDKQNS